MNEPPRTPRPDGRRISQLRRAAWRVAGRLLSTGNWRTALAPALARLGRDIGANRIDVFRPDASNGAAIPDLSWMAATCPEHGAQPGGTLELRIKVGKTVWGTLVVHTQSGAAPKREAAALRPVAQALGAAIERARSAHLETRVARLKTARRRMERGNVRLARILENNVGACISLDSDGRITYLNRAAARLLGRERSELFGTHVPADHRAIFSDEVGRALEVARHTGQAVTLAHLVAETATSLESHIFPARDGVSIYLRDITERKRAEAELQVERDYALQVMNTMGQGLAVTSTVGCFEYVNPSYARLLGTTPEDLVGKSVFDVVPHEDRRRLEEQLEWRRQGRSATYETRMVRPDGSTVDVLITAVPRWRLGEVVGTVAVITDMSAQKATENALRQGEQLVRRFIDQAADVVIIHSLDGTLVDVNQLACESLGYTREELLRMHVDEIEVAYLPSGHPELDAQIAAGAPVTLYGVHRRKDGSHFPVEVRVAQVDTGTDRLRVATVRDITERRRREAREQFLTEASRVLALPREYEEVLPMVGQLAAAKLHATTTVDLLDRSGWIVRIAAAASPGEDSAFASAVAASVPTLAAPLGVGAVIREGRTVYGVAVDPLAVVGCDAPDRVRETLRGRPYVIVPIPGRADARGAFTFVRLVGGQAFDAEDVAALEELARLVGLAIDKAESYREVQATKERYRLLFESNPHPMWVVDVETLRFLAVNDAAVEYLGYARDEFAELTVENICQPEDLNAHLEFLTRLRDASRPDELRLKTRDGRVAVMEASAHDIAFEGRPARLALLNDVTERKRLEVELRYAQKLESIGRLASGIAHEINTPVQFIGDSVHFLQDGFGGLLSLVDGYRAAVIAAGAAPLDAAVLDALRDAEDAADLDYVRENVPRACERTLAGIHRVAEIVRAMREFAHPGPTEQAPADLNRLVGNALMVARNEYKYVADVETEFGDIPLVVCHAGDLGQAFLNMIVNAAHAIRSVVGESGERGMIRVTTRTDGEMSEVAITDSGCGIPAAVRDRIFDPFFTTKAVGEGTGQGLAIARAIVVDRHGGTIEFETYEGKGTTFTIRLPVSGGQIQAGGM